MLCLNLDVRGQLAGCMVVVPFSCRVGCELYLGDAIRLRSLIAVACSLERKDFRILKSTKERMLKIAASNLHGQDEWEFMMEDVRVLNDGVLEVL